MSRPDPEILERARAGDRAAIGALIEPELDRVYATCRRMIGNRDDAAEVAQDALVRAIRGIGSFDGNAAFSTWLTRVTMNTCLSWHRARGRREAAAPGLNAGRGGGEYPGEVADPKTGGAGEPSGLAGVQEGEGPRSRVEAALELIKPEHRAVLVLRDVRGLEYEAIAAALDLRVGTVKSRLFRARAAMREALAGMEGEPPPDDPRENDSAP